MSKIEEIEQIVEQLPVKDFVKLAARVDQRRRQLDISPLATDKGYAPQDEGLYDDAATR